MGPKPVRTSAKRQRRDDDDSNDPTMTTAAGRQRTRVSRACNECRKRKDRCDGCRPVCDNCSRLGRICNYRPSKKRGLRTGYVRAIETLLGLIFMTIEDTEQWLCSLLNEQGVVNSDFRLRPPAGDSVESLLDTWRQSQMAKQLEQLLSPTETIDDEDEELDGETSSLFDRRTLDAISSISKVFSTQDAVTGNYPTYQQPSPMNTEPSSLTIQQSQLGSTAHFTTLPTPLPLMTPNPTRENFRSPTTVCSSPNQGHQPAEPQPSKNPPLPPNWQQMLDLYFARIHCWFPVAPKHDLLRTAYTLESGNGPASPTQGELAFLMAVLTFASSQSHIVEGTTQIQLISEPRQSESLFAITQDLLSSEPNAHELGHIRALLVLCLIHIRNKEQKAAWFAIGRAVYAATLLEGTPLTNPKPISADGDGVKRTILCCIALDSLVASWVCARPYFQRSDITDVGMLPTEGIEEWEPLQPQSMVQTTAPSQQQPARILSTFNNFMEFIGCFNNLLKLSADVDANHLRKLSQDFHNQIQLLAPISTSSPSTPAHNLNLHLLATCITTSVNSKLICLVGMESDPGTQNTARLRELCDVVEQYHHSLATLAMPPTFHLYINTICRSLEQIIQLPTNSQDTYHALRVLQQRFVNFTPVWPNTSRRPASFQSNNDVPFVISHAPNRTAPFRDQNAGLARNHITNTPMARNDPDISVQSRGSFALSGEIQPPFASLLQSPQSECITSQTSAQTDQDQSNLIGDVYPNSLTGFVPSDIDDDGLFQSLMDLDATDWSANSPNFMRQLGAPSNLSANLNFFICPDQR